MSMSPELIATLSVGVTMVIGMFSGFACMIQRIDRGDDRLGASINARIDRLDDRVDKLDNRIDKLDNRIDKLDNRIDKLGNRIDGLTQELTEVKITIARLEGPPPRLAFTR
ncbi:coiled-coil domain-containing protein [Microbacterium sp. NPDC057650]|uniref:coiled-coil domain-containing protein n=1 Tax=unclassified Microbacterium TaxID=2609290 RepID=UPI00366CBF4C